MSDVEINVNESEAPTDITFEERSGSIPDKDEEDVSDRGEGEE